MVLKPYVIADMKKSGILASLTAAQAYIESNKGNSGLTRNCNNLFGIKGTYNGQYGEYWTTEYYNGVKQRVRAKFRKYPSWAESIADHSSLFNRLERYKNLRGLRDYRVACLRVQSDGYATAPDYSVTLLKIIERFKLYEWDYLVNNYELPPANQGILLPTLKFGARSPYVLAWQKFLNLNGYFCGLEDGIFGKNTELAVKDWQNAHGLKADGIIGPKTWNALNK